MDLSYVKSELEVHFVIFFFLMAFVTFSLLAFSVEDTTVSLKCV